MRRHPKKRQAAMGSKPVLVVEGIRALELGFRVWGLGLRVEG
jgi:hypothetical protein